MLFTQNKPKTHWSLLALRPFIHELHQLLDSGIPLFSALNLLQQHLPHPQEKMLAKQLQQIIARGESFSTAWHTATAEQLSTTLLACGEQAGLLSDMLQHIKNYADKQKQIKQLIWQAIRYPIFLFALTCGLLSLLCGWVIPQFTALYKNFNVPMPALTEAILSGCTFVQQKGVYVLCLIFCLMMLSIFLRKNNQYEKFLQCIQRRFALYRQTQELRFWHTSSLLLQAKIPLTQTLVMCQQAINDHHIKQQIIYLIEQLKHGVPLSSVLKKLNGFSPKLIAMLSLGEVSGQLEKALHMYVTQQTEYLQTHIQALKVWLEPLCLCVIGSIVGIVLIALYLPIIELGKWV